jgi:hypothetical protein
MTMLCENLQQKHRTRTKMIINVKGSGDTRVTRSISRGACFIMIAQYSTPDSNSRATSAVDDMAYEAMSITGTIDLHRIFRCNIIASMGSPIIICGAPTPRPTSAAASSKTPTEKKRALVTSSHAIFVAD